jgi:hypothetical protein
MKFSKSPYHKQNRFILERSPQRVAAARRAVQRDMDSVPLFPELVRFDSAEERLEAIEGDLREWNQSHRDIVAKAWRRARRELNTLQPITRTGILRYWNSGAWFPREPYYLLDQIWGVKHRGENPWRTMRILRQLKLMGQGKLPRNIFKSIQAWD